MRALNNQTALSVTSLIAIQAVLFSSLAVPLDAQQDSPPPFHIAVIEGEGAINNIRQVINRGATVQVLDQNQNPLSGVAVTFFLPSEGPSGLFPNGSRVLTVFTDDRGLASSRGIRFNNLVGLMPIRVVASLFSQTSDATVTQTNVSSAASVRSSYVPAIGQRRVAPRPRSVKKILAVLGILGAAAGAGFYFATRKSTPTATISIGQPTVTGPQ